MTLTGDELFEALRGTIEKLHELPGLSDTGKMLFRNATLKIYNRATLRAVVQQVDQIDLAPHEGHDLKGDMYEYLLSKLSQSGTNGQFRTPRHIIDLIVKLVDPDADQRICDPACGTAGFLVSAHSHILRKHTRPADLEAGYVDGSLLCEGSIISGAHVERSIVAPGVFIDHDAHVTDSILFQGVRVGPGARLHRCIVDKNVLVPEWYRIGLDEGHDRERFAISAAGIAVIEKDARLT